MKKVKTTHKLAAAATSGMMMASSKGALAGAINANDLVGNIMESSKSFTDMINLLGYIGGSGLAVAGIFKLKQHVDNPGQHPMKDGLMRLAAGGGLLALPFMTRAMQGSVSNGNNDALTITKLDTFSSM